jgi:hypothetical protein
VFHVLENRAEDRLIPLTTVNEAHFFSYIYLNSTSLNSILDKMMRSSKQEELTFEDERSSTEVEEALIPGKEDEEWHTEISSNQKSRSCYPSKRWLLEAGLLLVIIGLLIERFKFPSRTYDITGDVTGFAPNFKHKVMAFEPDLDFIPANTSTFWDQSVRDKWLGSVPRGLGYVRVTDPSKYVDLPTPIHDYPDETVFTTSMPHQLHCLYNILEVYAAMTSENPHGVPTEMTFHLRHCFE